MIVQGNQSLNQMTAQLFSEHSQDVPGTETPTFQKAATAIARELSIDTSSIDPTARVDSYSASLSSKSVELNFARGELLQMMPGLAGLERADSGVLNALATAPSSAGAGDVGAMPADMGADLATLSAFSPPPSVSFASDTSAVSAAAAAPAAPLRLLDFGGFQTMLRSAADNAASPAEVATAALNLDRAEVLYEHYRLGADQPGARILHRRGQNDLEAYRTMQTRLHSMELTWKGDGAPTEELGMLYFGDKSQSAEDYLRTTGQIYDPIGVERTFPAHIKPDAGAGHDMQSNFAWALGAIHAGHPFEMVGPLTPTSLERGSRKGEASALLREVKSLENSGYELTGLKGTDAMPVLVLEATSGSQARMALTLSDLNQMAPSTDMTPPDDPRLFDARFDDSAEAVALGAREGHITQLQKMRSGRPDSAAEDLRTWAGSSKISGADPIGVKSR